VAKRPRNWQLYGALALSAVLAGLLVWQAVRNAQTTRQFEAERAQLAASHERERTNQAEQLLRTSGTLLGAAIHAPLATGDFETIEGVIKLLVQEKPIALVAVADQEGLIRIATNHKLEGQRLDETFPGVTLGSSVVVTKLDGSLVVAIPVVHAEQPVGRAMISYAIP
jgi:uncharacterized membrane protein affecting hemolysin expression